MPPTYGQLPAANPPTNASAVLFDPARTEKELYDELAERQAERLEINSSQLRRFFGEVKDLFRQFTALIAGETDDQRKDAVYRQKIEPRFKMVRSKVAYAMRKGGRAPLRREFAEFLQQGISRVTDHQQFTRFVLHFEAVVGFMYGKEKVSNG